MGLPEQRALLLAIGQYHLPTVHHYTACVEVIPPDMDRGPVGGSQIWRGFSLAQDHRKYHRARGYREAGRSHQWRVVPRTWEVYICHPECIM